MSEYVIEMLNITKRFPGIVANDNITLQLKKGEIHALLGENGAGKSTLMSVLFGLYQPEEGEIRKNGKKVDIQDPNDANELGIGMVHQHFKLVECFSVLDNIMLGVETTTKGGFLKKDEARKKVVELSEKYGLSVDPDAKIENITVGMQQRTEILKMLYRDNEVLIFDEPTAVLTPQEINELMVIMKNLAAEGKSILFITHKLAEIMAVADRCSVLRKGKYIGTVDIKDTTPEKLSAMMVGRDVNFVVDKKPAKTGDVVLSVRNMTVASKQHKNNAVNHVSFDVRRGEIVCIAGIDGNGQSELVYGLSGLEPVKEGTITMNGQDITNMPIRRRITSGMSHIPEDRHKHGLVLDYSLEDNIVLERYFEPQFTNRFGFLKRKEIRKYANRLIKQYDIRSGQGPVTKVLSMSGGNQQKAIIAIMKNFFYYPNAAAATKYFGTTLIKASALLMCALSVIFAYKVGLFNIGAAGQYVIGAGGCLYMALRFNLPWYICLIAGVLIAAAVGGISGALKAYLNVNEVISCIMLNWISLYSVNMLLSQVKDGSTPYTKLLFSYNKSAMLPTAGLNELFHNKYMTIGVPMAVIAAIIVWVVLQKTKFGFELKATGINKLAAKYCGMHEKRNIIVTMMISGGLAGFGAGIFYLSGIEQWMVQQTSVPGMGFNGIAAAFLGGLDPIGTIFASYFIQHITSGGTYVDTTTYCTQISDLISAFIIYLCAFVFFFKIWFNRYLDKKEEKSVKVKKGGRK